MSQEEATVNVEGKEKQEEEKQEGTESPSKTRDTFLISVLFQERAKALAEAAAQEAALSNSQPLNVKEENAPVVTEKEATMTDDENQDEDEDDGDENGGKAGQNTSLLAKGYSTVEDFLTPSSSTHEGHQITLSADQEKGPITSEAFEPLFAEESVVSDGLLVDDVPQTTSTTSDSSSSTGPESVAMAMQDDEEKEKASEEIKDKAPGSDDTTLVIDLPQPDQPLAPPPTESTTQETLADEPKELPTPIPVPPTLPPPPPPLTPKKKKATFKATPKGKGGKGLAGPFLSHAETRSDWNEMKGQIVPVEQEKEADPTWARLISLNPDYDNICLTSPDEVIFGRSSSAGQSRRVFPKNVSKEHFSLWKEDNDTFLKDLSANGLSSSSPLHLNLFFFLSDVFDGVWFVGSYRNFCQWKETHQPTLCQSADR